MIENTMHGRFRDAHAMDFDSQGRLFVGDKVNGRVQIFDQDLNLLDVWTPVRRACRACDRTGRYARYRRCGVA